MGVRERAVRVVRWEHFFLCVIVAITLAMHFTTVNPPSDTILDEIHYVRDARSIISQHYDERPEHPPLAKLIIVGGIEAFGDGPWGWRVFPILFGTAGLIFFYFLCRKLGMGRTGSNLAVFLLGFENATYVQNHVAMLDVFYVSLMMAGFLLYVSKRYVTSGVALGLSALCKLDGALGGPVIFIHWLFSRVQKHSRWFGVTAIMTIVTFLEGLIVFDWFIVHKFSTFLDPIHRIRTMLELSGSLTFANVTHPALSRPWQWLIGYKPMAYYVDPHYTSAISFTVWALAIPAFLYMVWKAFRHSEAGLFGAAWFFGTFLIWIPADIITNRATYPYYFYPTIGAVCLGIGLLLADLVSFFKRRPHGWLRWAAISFVVIVIVAHLLSFFILSPVFNYDYSWFFKPII